MFRMINLKSFIIGLAVVLTITTLPMIVGAETLLERVKGGDTLLIGYSNEAPYAFHSKDGEMSGFMNVVNLAVLKKMNIANYKGIVTEWGALIPGLKAKRFDIITAGMYILPKRCGQVAFTEPIGEFGESFLVKKGNPLDLHSFEDVKNNPKAILATVAGYSTVNHAKKLGIPDERIMQVSDPAGMLQAVKSGRADAASATVFAIMDLVGKSGGDVERATPFMAPSFTMGYSAYAFRKEDQNFVDAYNAVLKEFVGSEEFLQIVKPFMFTKNEVPSPGVTAAKLCSGELP